MPKAISRRNFLKRLEKLGFCGPFSGGKYQFMIKGELKLHIPNKHQKDISPSLINEILKQAGISKTDWEKK